MRKLFFGGLLLFLFAACHDDESYKQNVPENLKPADIQLIVTGRVGSVVGDSLTQYIGALNLLLFREDGDGNYVLYDQKVLNEAELRSLEDVGRTAEPGFTIYKEIAFDSVPISNYRIVGLGNVLNANGNSNPVVSLWDAVVGTPIRDVLVNVLNGSESPRLFWGMTEVIQAGGQTEALPVLRLYRKVSMFALSLMEVPDVVDRIAMDFTDTYGGFNTYGEFSSGTVNEVQTFRPYQQQPGDSVTLSYVMLPTVSGDSTAIQATFYLTGGGKQVIALPKYVLKPNTITKVRATIDTDQPGNVWKVDINSLITVNVEWNVDEEPPITI